MAARFRILDDVPRPAKSQTFLYEHAVKPHSSPSLLSFHSRLPAIMAHNLPTIATPDEASEGQEHPSGLGMAAIQYPSPASVTFDPNALSPASQQFTTRFGSMASPLASPASTYSSMSVDSNGEPKSGRSEEGAMSPFNFQTTTMAKSPVIKQVRPPLSV